MISCAADGFDQRGRQRHAGRDLHARPVRCRAGGQHRHRLDGQLGRWRHGYAHGRCPVDHTRLCRSVNRLRLPDHRLGHQHRPAPASHAATPINVTVKQCSKWPDHAGHRRGGRRRRLPRPRRTRSICRKRPAMVALGLEHQLGRRHKQHGRRQCHQHPARLCGRRLDWPVGLFDHGHRRQRSRHVRRRRAGGSDGYGSRSDAEHFRSGDDRRGELTLDLSAIEPAVVQASGMTVSSWTINWGDGTTSTIFGAADSASHVFVTSPVGDSTTYDITATATDDSGTTGTGSQSVTVSPVDADLHAQRRGYCQRRRHLHAHAHADRGCPARRLDRQLGRRFDARSSCRRFERHACLRLQPGDGVANVQHQRHGHHRCGAVISLSNSQSVTVVAGVPTATHRQSCQGA